jgi:hypothetical protein
LGDAARLLAAGDSVDHLLGEPEAAPARH